MKVKKFLTSAGAIVAGLAIPLVFITFLVLFLKGSTYLVNSVLPALLVISGIAWVLNVILLPFSLSKRLCKYLWTVFFVSSFVYGISAWLTGFAYTVYFFGYFWLIIGLFFAGIGVVPIGLLALGTHHMWSDFWQLLILTVSTYVARFVAVWMAERAEGKTTISNHDEVIDYDSYTDEVDHQPSATVAAHVESSSLEYPAKVSKDARKHKVKNEKIQLFNISLPRLVVLSVITLGLYEIYWFYRNWKALKPVDSSIKHPFWRGVFAVFYCYSFFKKILHAAKRLGYKKSYKAGLLATTYIILLLIGEGWGRASNLDKSTDIALMVLASLSFLPLLPVQKAVNYMNHRQHNPKETKFTGGELAVIIIGVIFFGAAIYATAIVPHTYISPENQQQAADLKAKADSLTSQYDSCSSNLNRRYSTLDKTSQEAVDSYNADYDSCESIRQQQNQAVDDYNNLTKQQ